ncbi:DP-EP family protein [Lacimicrobium alkaliphilum]|uniref:Cadherin domain-containing protein n=1 Tax=Lacimicrobium alkaliphilum TaxID=1526571 RepID=A0ABQ1RLW8_9ALTE|nr:DP-EP family protein [Lacimicrobium alkaliphilum]GGD74933.1 hypothetical protein GCM10011357_32390 [Lacimicrobium alkaliphilum]
MTDTPQIEFKVTVDISVTPPVFTIYNQQGHIDNNPINVTENNTRIIYRLKDNNDGLKFIAPEVSDDPHGDITPSISEDGQTLTITDSDADNETICVRLVVIQANSPDTHYVSQDPQIRNRPPA